MATCSEVEERQIARNYEAVNRTLVSIRGLELPTSVWMQTNCCSPQMDTCVFIRITYLKYIIVITKRLDLINKVAKNPLKLGHTAIVKDCQLSLQRSRITDPDNKTVNICLRADMGTNSR